MEKKNIPKDKSQKRKPTTKERNHKLENLVKRKINKGVKPHNQTNLEKVDRFFHGGLCWRRTCRPKKLHNRIFIHNISNHKSESNESFWDPFFTVSARQNHIKKSRTTSSWDLYSYCLKALKIY